LTEDLGKKHVAAKFVQRLLSQEQKEFRAKVAQDLSDTANKDPDFPKKVLTGDELWVYGYESEPKAQSSQWDSPGPSRPKKTQSSRINVKAMLAGFFCHEGVFHHEYAPAGQTITMEFYIEILRRLTDALGIKRLQFIYYTLDICASCFTFNQYLLFRHQKQICQS
jgi:hypothetical protein